MKQSTGIAVAVIAAVIAAGAGYWLGHKGPASQAQGALSATAAAVDTGAGSTSRKLLYYRNPMGLPDTSPPPKKDRRGRK